MNDESRAALGDGLPYERLLEVLRLMPSGVVVAEAPSGKVLFYNAEAARLCDRAQAPAGTERWTYGTGSPLRNDGSSYHPDELPLARTVRDGGKAVTGEELRLQRGDGSWVVIAVSTVPIRDEHGAVVAGVATFTDVTSRSRFEDELRTAQERLRGLVDAVDGIVWEVDLESFCFTFVSQQAERLLGYPVEDWYRPHFWTNILVPDDRDWAVGFCLERTARKEAHDFEYRVHTRDGRVVWLRDIVSVVVKDDRPVALRGIMVDVTARRETEERLQQAQKMEAVGNLAGGVAHDFNNLLSVILGYSSLLASDMGPSDPRRAELAEIEAAGLRAAELTRQLLAFSRKQLLQPRVVSLNEILTRIERMLGRLIGEDIELRLSLHAELGHTKVDPVQVELIVMNLAVNSRDAMPSGGRLVLETANVELDEAYAARNTGVTPGPHVMLAVSDTGVGMTADTKARMFEPFFTTKEVGKGTGLGLATVFGIVQQSGGSVSAESEPGKGTTFRLYFPRVDVVADVQADARPDGRARSGTETILLVEDDAGVRGLARSVLRRAGYRVLEAETGDAAIAMCASHPEDIDLLVTDVVMPRMSGRQLAERLRPLRPEMKVLFMSGYADDVSFQQGVLDAGVAFLQKPLMPESFSQKVREVLDAPRG